MDTASNLISNNSSRVSKKLWSSANQGELVKLNCYRTGKEEAQGVSDIIEQKIKKNYSLNDVSILVRAIYQTREFEERFLQIGIGYRVLGGIKFYERAEIKDAVAYLRIINQKFDDLALERVIGSPKRGVGESTLNQIYIFGKHANEINKCVNNKNKKVFNELSDVEDHLNKYNQKNVLFSPGYPSGDDFSNFEERGVAFNKIFGNSNEN